VARLRLLIGSRYGAIAELARETGKDRSIVARWVKGQALPPLSWLIAVADAHETTVDWLLGREPADALYGTPRETPFTALSEVARSIKLQQRQIEVRIPLNPISHSGVFDHPPSEAAAAADVRARFSP
jgi:hypothetical protein